MKGICLNQLDDNVYDVITSKEYLLTHDFDIKITIDDNSINYNKLNNELKQIIDHIGDINLIKEGDINE